MKTKQQLIQEAYEPWWEQIKDYLDEDGWHDLDEYMKNKSNYNTLLGLTSTVHPYKPRVRRAVNLDGLEDNNGWLPYDSTIEIDSQTNYSVHTEKGSIVVLLGSILKSTQRKNVVKITHVKPIEKPKPPLWIIE